ncbi:indolepyruvate oxidoreductase subunit beta [Clostridium sp. OS1-26]|uniref:indolepyruvate oxidoreductase subunit beta n=1 Tax=Clostridium sp. OS1-26 TaxID=3070681 RepID=UPI0027DFD57E|nr:indolepyruvate oxidoreductase subunit beta [Clostridium sp. OS1-26]WML36377.1 indolepyruvate oxidoreductase subunit beta [Clostridium sp. OS1-26]
MSITNILISGVGGQGLVVATKILAETAFKEGYDIRTSDVIGLSQRGGMVWGSVRFGEKVYSPIIPKGEGDILLAMEKLEGLRWAKSLRNGAKVIVNDEIVFPNRVLIEKEEYPENIEDKIRSKGLDVISIEANKIAKDSGNIKTANIVLLGCLSKFLPFKEESWIEVIKNNVPKSTIDANIEAFKKGRV